MWPCAPIGTPLHVKQVSPNFGTDVIVVHTDGHASSLNAWCASVQESARPGSPAGAEKRPCPTHFSVELPQPDGTMKAFTLGT